MAHISQSDPNNAQLQGMIARDVDGIGHADRALPYANQAVALAPNDADVRALRGSIRHELGDDRGALEDAKAALRLDPTNGSARALVELVRSPVGASGARPGGLPAAAQKAEQDDGRWNNGPRNAELVPFLSGPQHARTRELLGVVNEKMKIGAYGDAMALAAQAMEIDPGNPLPYFQSAVAKMNLKDYDGAVSDVDRAIGLGLPTTFRLMGRMLEGRALLAQGKYAGAKAAANDALAINPRSSAAHFVRAQAAEALGERGPSVLEDYRLAQQYATPSELDDMTRAYQDAMARQSSPASSRNTASAPIAGSSPMPTQEAESGPRAEASAPPFASTRGASLPAPLIFFLAAAILALVVFGVRHFFSRGAAAAPEALASRGAPGTPAPPASASVPQARPAERDSVSYERSTIEIGRMIGQGGMGTVYEGEDKALGRKVAVKELRSELQADPKLRERFLKEAQLVAQLQHPNIVMIHSVINTANRTLLVFEYIDGRTLADVLHNSPQRRLSPRQALDVARQVCSALEFAHSKHVVHRDLKPSNIMIEENGRVKVMDFGIARQAKDSMMAMTNTVMGTPYYMAPEMEEGAVGQESDLYSFSVCLYEMIVGDVPFDGPGCMRLKREGSFRLPSKIDPAFSPKLDAFFQKALSPRPQDRPHDAVELMNEFFKAALT